MLCDSNSAHLRVVCERFGLLGRHSFVFPCVHDRMRLRPGASRQSRGEQMAVSLNVCVVPRGWSREPVEPSHA